MSSNLIAIQPIHPANLDDEITALALQLEEINCHGENQKGKYPANNPPDIEHFSLLATLSLLVSFVLFPYQTYIK